MYSCTLTCVRTQLPGAKEKKERESSSVNDAEKSMPRSARTAEHNGKFYFFLPPGIVFFLRKECRNPFRGADGVFLCARLLLWENLQVLFVCRLSAQNNRACRAKMTVRDA